MFIAHFDFVSYTNCTLPLLLLCIAYCRLLKTVWYLFSFLFVFYIDTPTIRHTLKLYWDECKRKVKQAYTKFNLHLVYSCNLVNSSGGSLSQIPIAAMLFIIEKSA